MLKFKLSAFIKGLFFSAIITSIGIALYKQNYIPDIFASNQQYDNTGTIIYTANDDAGAYNLKTTQISGGFMEILPTFTKGSFGVSQKKPISSFGRDNITIDGNNINPSTVPKIDIYQCGSAPGEIGGLITTLLGSQVANSMYYDISGIDPNITCFNTVVSMRSVAGVRPAISNITTKFVPKPVVDMDLSGDISATAGDCTTYTYRRSLSYVDKNNFGIYVTLPASASNTVTNFNPAYNQFPSYDPVYKSSSDNGFYTTGGTTVNGVNIPANSIYRDPNNAKEGNTYSYKFIICSPKGTQTGTIYKIQAFQAYEGNITSSNIVTTYINSSPLGELNNVLNNSSILRQFMQGGYDAGSGGVQIGAATASSQKKIIYYYDAANGRRNQTATEDIFNPVITIDFSGVFANLQASCGDTGDVDSRARVVLPANFVWVGQTAVKALTGNMLVSNHDTDFWLVDYNGCDVANTKLDIVVKFDGDNIDPLYFNYPLTIISGITPTPNGGGSGRVMSIGETFEGFSNLYGGEGEYWVRNPGIGDVEKGQGPLYHIGSDYYGVYTVGVTYGDTNNSLGNNMIITQIPDDFEIVDVIQGQYWMGSTRDIQASGFTIRQIEFGPRRAGVNYDEGYFILDKGILRGTWTPNVGYGPDATSSVGDFYYNGLYPVHDGYKFFYSSDPGSIISSYPSYTLPASSLTGGLPASIGSNWTTSPTSGSRWVGMYVRCIENYRKEYQDAFSTICARPAPATMKIIVKAKNKYTCGSASPVLTSNSRLFYDYRTNNAQNRDQDFVYQPGEVAGISNGGGPNGGNGLQMQASWDSDLLTQNQTTVKTQIVDNGGSFAPNNAIVKGPDSLNAAENGSYNFLINNGSGAAMSNINLIIDIPSVDASGTQIIPNISVTQGIGTVTSQTSNQVIINLGNLAANQSISPIINISYPVGFSDNTPIILTGTYEYNGECGQLSGVFSKLVTLRTVFTSPNLSGSKYVSTGEIDIAGSIVYAIDIVNQGTKIARGTWIIDNIPSGTEITEAYTAGNIEAFANFAALASQTYQCNDCEVYFSKGENIPGGTPAKDIATTISNSGVSVNNFILGSNNNGVRTPSGMTFAEVRRIAFNAKDVDINERNIIGFKVKNQDNLNSDTIVNVAALVSNELKAATTNQVETNLLYDPRYNKFDISLEKYVHSSGQVMSKSITGAQAGDQLYFELIIKNLSGQTATHVSAKDILPIGFTINGNISTVDIEGTLSGAAGFGLYDSATRTITWSDVSLGSGDYAIMTIPVSVDALDNCGIITNSGQIIAFTGIDINPNNHVSSADVYQCSSFDLSLTKSVNHYFTRSGDTLTYAIDRKKLSGPIVRNYVITDKLPSEVTYVSSTNSGTYDPITNSVKWILPDLIGQAGGTYYVTVNVTKNPDSYKFTNSASICENNNVNCCNSRELRCDNNTGTADNEVYDLKISKTVNKATSFFGETLVYNLTYNLFGSARNDISIVDKIPDEVDFVSASMTGYKLVNNFSGITGQFLIWTGISLPNNGNGTITINATIKPYTYFEAKGQSIAQAITTSIINNVVIGTNTGSTDTGFTYNPETNTGNNTGQAITYMRCNADPSLTCNGGGGGGGESPRPYCRNGQVISLFTSMVQSGDIAGTCPVNTINVCRNDQVISINASELQSTDIQSNSCPKTLVCRNNKMIAISKSQKLSTDTPYCVPPYEPIPYVPPILIPKTGVDVFDGIESLR